MFNDHPTDRDFEAFLRGSTHRQTSASDARVLRHLLAECDACKQQLSQMGWGQDRLARLMYVPASQSEVEMVSPGSLARTYNYDRAFARASGAVEALLAEVPSPVVDPQVVLDRLHALPEHLRSEALSRNGHECSAQLVHRLVDLSHEARFSDPEAMLLNSKLAVHAAALCTAAACGGSTRLADLRSLAAGQYANALRVSGQLREAEESGLAALSYLKDGTSDPLLRARIYEQLATVYLGQRKFENAISLLREAGQIHRLVGETHGLANAMVVEAIATLYSGEPEAATRLLNQAIPLIDQEVDPHLLLAACHNLVRCYIDLDRPEQALALYNEVSDLYRELKGELNQLRAAWQEGQLLRDLGHPQAAETVLLRARQGFLDRRMMYEVALISLDLAAVYIKTGRVSDVQQMAETTVPIFRALGIEREELAALLQLQQVAGHQQRALELLRFLNSRIQPGTRDEVLK